VELMAGHEPDRRDSDEGLIRRILSGDEAALGLLYDRYGGRVYSAAKHILQDTGAAEEVLQDIFHQLWRAAASFDSTRGSLAGWLLVMARNRSIDRLRRRAPAVGEEVTATLHGAVLDIETAAARNEMAERVRAALQALPEAQREAMELAYFEGLTQSEIAKRTGDPLGTVKTRLRTALASLKADLGE
jgi:RNA polymerase sigma-70 factor (ECF subfamily)